MHGLYQFLSYFTFMLQVLTLQQGSIAVLTVKDRDLLGEVEE